MSDPAFQEMAQGLKQQQPGQQGHPMQPMQGFQRGNPMQAGQGFQGMQMPPMQTQAARFQQMQPGQYQPPPAFRPTQQFVQQHQQNQAAAADAETARLAARHAAGDYQGS